MSLHFSRHITMWIVSVEWRSLGLSSWLIILAFYFILFLNKTFPDKIYFGFQNLSATPCPNCMQCKQTSAIKSAWLHTVLLQCSQWFELNICWTPFFLFVTVVCIGSASWSRREQFIHEVEMRSYHFNTISFYYKNLDKVAVGWREIAKELKASGKTTNHC